MPAARSTRPLHTYAADYPAHAVELVGAGVAVGRDSSGSSGAGSLPQSATAQAGEACSPMTVATVTGWGLRGGFRVGRPVWAHDSNLAP